MDGIRSVQMDCFGKALCSDLSFERVNAGLLRKINEMVIALRSWTANEDVCSSMSSVGCRRTLISQFFTCCHRNVSARESEI